MKVDAHEIANRVVVLVAVEPAEGHATGVEGASTVGRGQGGLNPGRQGFRFGPGRLKFVFRRHQAAPDIIRDLFPGS